MPKSAANWRRGRDSKPSVPFDRRLVMATDRLLTCRPRDTRRRSALTSKRSCERARYAIDLGPIFYQKKTNAARRRRGHPWRKVSLSPPYPYRPAADTSGPRWCVKNYALTTKSDLPNKSNCTSDFYFIRITGNQSTGTIKCSTRSLAKPDVIAKHFQPSGAETYSEQRRVSWPFGSQRNSDGERTP
jgi:hypothetical protein